MLSGNPALAWRENTSSEGSGLGDIEGEGDTDLLLDGDIDALGLPEGEGEKLGLNELLNELDGE